MDWTHHAHTDSGEETFFNEAAASPSQSQISLVSSDATSHLAPPTINDCSSQPPQCTTPISIMYDFLAHHNLPCKYKPTFERNAQRCLLSLGEGDQDAWSSAGSRVGGKVGSSHMVREQRRKKKKHDKRAVYATDGRTALKQLSGGQSSREEEDSGDRIQSLMTSDDVYTRLGNLLSPNLFAEGFGQWITCPYTHYLSVNDNIPDNGFYKTKYLHPRRSMGLHYHGDTSSCFPSGRQSSSACGRLGVKHASSTVIRTGSNKDAGQGSRPTSSEVTEKDLWQDLELELQPVYSFKHFKQTQQYAEQYRDVYTYSQLREKSGNALAAAKLQKTCIPRAGLVCYKAAKQTAKGMVGSKLSNHGRSQGSMLEREVEQPSSAIKWQMSPRLKDSCDPHLSVNNPSPTELTTLGKMPIIRRSSPSIPSNTNGKYGGRGSNRLYPFQLQISTESRTVSSPYKRLARSLLQR